MQHRFQSIYDRLLDHYGPQSWWPADTPFEMMIGSILVQNTNWRNVNKALLQLRPHLEPVLIDKMPIDKLAQIIRSSGFFNIKAKRIKAFIDWFKDYDYDIGQLKKKDKNQLRYELLKINGIGRETADVMLLYAFHKPIFVVDAYARRIFYRIGFDMPTTYDGFRMVVEKALPSDLQLYNEYHALLVQHAKEHCKSSPICKGCPLNTICEQRLN
ncbi:endonuclease III domain-containing protein [Oceanobacillus damuensis]|uniref:endonuclease III domain-containing protein n=1 Tax=Oceanobacillus damuensis TaxID=937928 RepID=UPI000836BA80|nr:endonuclease III domain-containing protein [Oceanobacillus damuensis]